MSTLGIYKSSGRFADIALLPSMSVEKLTEQRLSVVSGHRMSAHVGADACGKSCVRITGKAWLK